MAAHDWADTLATLHMWTQVVGKIRMAQTPPLNHWWHVPLYVSARGLTTTAIPYAGRLFELDFDFIDHRLIGQESGGSSFAIDLVPMSVAAFYRAVMDGLASLGIEVRIRTNPVEVEVAIPFEQDEQHAAYDREHAHALWQHLSAAHAALTRFRARFIGKASPVHFFWGGFDIATTRFSGRTAPLHAGGVLNCPDWVMHEAYSHEVSSAGWWPGTDDTGPAYYAYMYPEPAGYPTATLGSAPGFYHPTLREFVLSERQLSTTDNPDAALQAFFSATYTAGATLADWNRESLERR
jgi:hypothetical protein